MTAVDSRDLPSASPTAPRAPGRMRPLDVLRGIAILGTLGTNIFVWVMIPFASQGQGFGNAALSPVEAVITQLTNGKFLSLLTLMFGMGLVIQFAGAERRGQRWPHVYLWRGALLFLDGVLHYVLVFAFDVLMSYAVTGIIVAFLLVTRQRVQRIVCAIMAGIHIVIAVGADIFILSLSPSDIEGFRSAAPSSEEVSWWAGVVDRVNNLLMNRMEAIFILPMAIALFLLGGFLLRAGIFEDRGERLRRALIWTGAIAFLLDVALALADWAGLLPQGSLGMGRRYLLPIFVAVGIAAAVAAFYRSRPVGWMGRRLEDVGCMALSCYVGQNIICMLLFSDWALNLDAFLPTELGVGVQVIAFVFVTVILIVFASLWRMRFRRGPLEWLWARSYRAAMRLTPALSQHRKTGESLAAEKL